MSWDAVQFCKDYNVPFTPPGSSNRGKVSPGWIGLSCPNPYCDKHGQDDYGGFNLAGGYYNCWSCGGHKLPTVIKWILHISEEEAIQIQWEYSGRFSAVVGLNNKKKKAKANKVILPGGPLKKSHRKYLSNRRFDPDFLIEKYELQATTFRNSDSLDNKYRNRIIIPIKDRNGRLISYQGRDITGEARLKYKGCRIEDSVFHYKHTLYGLPFCTGSRVGLVEGVFDKWRMGDGFVCSFGTAVTEHQIRELAFFDIVFIFFDPEKQAQEHAEKIAYKLAALGKQAEVICSDLGIDPGDKKFPDSEVKYIRRELGFV